MQGAITLLSKLSLANKAAVELTSVQKSASVKTKKSSKTKDCDDEYFLQVEYQMSSDQLAVLCSSNTVRIFNSNSLVRLAAVTGHTSTVSSVKFAHQTEQTLYTASIDGTIRLWDLRASCEKEQSLFKNVQETKPRALLSFDITCNDKFMCAGTQLKDEDAIIYFWDTRKSEPLGYYEDLHSDDVTQVCFHPEKQDSLLTGGDDGLVNYVDISQATEDDALQYTFNTEDVIARVGWNGNCLQAYGITFDNSLFMLDCTEGEDIEKKLLMSDFYKVKGLKQRVDYLVDCFNVEKTLCCLTGTNEGDAALFDLSQGSPSHIVSLEDGHSKIIRACTWNNKTNSVLTVGEDALLCSWDSKKSRSKSTTSPDPSKTKHVRKHTSTHSSKPYKK